MDLKNKIQLGLYQQRFNDPIPYTLYTGRYGKIQLDCFYADQDVQVVVEVLPPLKKGESLYNLGHRSSVYEQLKFFKRDEDIASNVHQLLCEYLESFNHDKDLMKELGFKCLGYNWYEHEGLNIIKTLSNDRFDFLFSWGNDNWLITQDQMKKPDLMGAFKLFGKDMDHYLKLPPKLRDLISA